MDNSSKPQINGCELCGDFPIHLHARCHPSSPLRAQMNREGELELFCYLPDCNRHVATFKVEQRVE